jgi:hypothetical protein
MCLGTRHKTKCVKMFLITTAMLFSKAHRRKPIPESPKHNFKFYFPTNLTMLNYESNFGRSGLGKIIRECRRRRYFQIDFYPV